MQEQSLIWITGAGSGIGRALARRYAADGWRVAVSARSTQDLETLAGEAGTAVRPYPLDVTDRAAVAATVERIEDELGPIDLAILNAGTYAPMFADDFDTNAFRRTIEVNLLGTTECLGALVPRMIGRGRGQLAVMASVAGFFGLPGAGAYGASKAGLNVLCQSLRPDLAHHGVSLTVINPGFVKTPLTDKNTFPMPFLIPVEEAVDQIVRRLPGAPFEISFPWQMRLLMKGLAGLPHGLQFAITRRMLR